MKLGINTQKSVIWNLRGFATNEMLTNNCRAGRQANKLEPSELMRTADCFQLDTNSRNGMNVLEGGSNDPLLVAASMAQANSSKCTHGKLKLKTRP